MNAGRVELDLVAVGKDQVSAMLRQVDAQLKKTAGEMGKTGAAAGGVGAKIDALKSATAPINKVRGAFEELKANAGLVVGAVVGVAAGIGAIAMALSKNMQAIHAWRDAQKDIAAAIVASHEAYLALQIALGNASADSGLESGVKKAQKRWEELSPLIDKASAAALAYADQIKRIEIDASNDSSTRFLAERTHVISKLEDQMHRAQNDLADMERERLNLELEIGDAIRTQGVELNKIVGISADITRARAAFAVPFFERWPAAAKPKPTGGGTKKPTPFQFHDIGAAVDQTGQIGEMSAGGPDEEPEWLAEMATLPTVVSDAEKVRDALHQVADAIGLVSDKFPELGNALSEVSAISDQFAAGQGTLAEALAAGGAAIVANAAKAVGGVKAEAAVRAAYEVGMGFATLANPVESAGHFTAAALLGAVAAGAGGASKGGGSRASGGGSSGGSGGSGGPTTIVNNFAMGIGDRQTITLALRQSERTSRGTGASSRAGV